MSLFAVTEGSRESPLGNATEYHILTPYLQQHAPRPGRMPCMPRCSSYCTKRSSYALIPSFKPVIWDSTAVRP